LGVIQTQPLHRFPAASLYKFLSSYDLFSLKEVVDSNNLKQYTCRN
jgi:hypothetical protein